MRACRGLSIAVAVSVAALSPPLLAQNGTKADPFDFVAFLPDPTGDADYIEMMDTFEAYADYLRQTGVGEFRVHYFTRLSEAEAFVKKGRGAGKPPAIGVIHNLLVPGKAAEWGFAPIACPVFKGSNLTSELVVSLRASGAKNVRDLKGQRLAALKVWIDSPDLLGLTLFGDATKPGGFFSSVVPTESLKECLAAVIRHEADAALVNKAFFDAAQRRNREVWKELKVVEELPAQHISPVVAFQGAPVDLVEKVKAVIFDSPDSDAGRHLLGVFGLDGFQPCGAQDFDGVEGKLVAKLGKPTAPVPATPAPSTAPSPQPEGSDAIASVDVERDADTGEISALIKFKGPAPAGCKAIVSLDDGPEEEKALDCAADVCMLTLAADDVKGKKRLALSVVVARDGKSTALGSRKTYPL
ncbi:MAG: PhnD/SsuA/transferrin family substrate-binding protein [Acidobacteriota bacterium]